MATAAGAGTPICGAKYTRSIANGPLSHPTSRLLKSNEVLHATRDRLVVNPCGLQDQEVPDGTVGRKEQLWNQNRRLERAAVPYSNPFGVTFSDETQVQNSQVPIAIRSFYLCR
jgi:hypothetical protein